MKWWHGLIVLILLAGGYGLYKIGSTPAPGQKIPDMGQDHVSPQKVLETKYNSNPPTSGPHLPTWVKPGVYDAPQSEGELIHSLEHGYVIISYNCGVHLGDNKTIRHRDNKKNILLSQSLTVLPSRVFAHEEEDTASSSAEPNLPQVATGSPSSSLRTSATNDTPACKTLVKQLTDLAQKKKLFKLIVVPRLQLDTTLALTAWTYVDKFDPDPIGIDTKRIEKFIDYHRDHGPEKTTE